MATGADRYDVRDLSLAASGVRLMIQLAAQFAERPDVRYGLTAMCVGLGQGGSVIWENPHFDGKKKK